MNDTTRQWDDRPQTDTDAEQFRGDDPQDAAEQPRVEQPPYPASSSQPLRILSAAEVDVLGERVFCDDELGLRHTGIASLPEPAALLRTNARNETVLRALAMLEEHDQTSSDDAERAELHRLEGKLDLALELMAELVRERQGAIPTRAVRFNARGLCWDSPEPLRAGDLLDVDCYALPPWPLPLKLYVRVTHAEQRKEMWRVCSRIEGLSAGVAEWLGKLVFRRHRRTIAQQRGRKNVAQVSESPEADST